MNTPEAAPHHPGGNDLVARYLHAIGKHLPQSRRDDILAELSANLLSEIEDREAGLGRALTAAEEIEFVKAHGRPFLVAARYSPQQYLIGPMVFPYYWLILRIALAMSAAVYFVANSIALTVQGATIGRIMGVIFQFPGTALITAAWVTLVFVGLEIAVTRYPSKSANLDDWKPESLPRATPDSPGRLRAVFDLTAHIGGVVWLAAAPHYPYLLFGPGAAYLDPGPIHATPALWALYWPLVALLWLPVVLRTAMVAALFRGKVPSLKQRTLLRIINGCVGLMVLLLVTRVHEFVMVVGNVAEHAKYQPLADGIDLVGAMGLRVCLAVGVVSVLWEVVKYIAPPSGWGFLKVRPQL